MERRLHCTRDMNALAAGTSARFNAMPPSRPAAVPSSAAEGEHLIGEYIGRPDGPTLIVIGSLHGNEPAGAFALVQMAEEVAGRTDKMAGRVYLIAGNTRALERGVRFIDADLNRHWTPQHMSSGGINTAMAENAELTELNRLIDRILVTAEDEVYVIDLHSTSAGGRPFATVGDTLRNRTFAQKFPVTILLGVEEQLDGTMLEYLNNAGAVTLGFEGGSHLSEQTVVNHKALVWTALANTGILPESDIAGLDGYRNVLNDASGRSRIVEVRYRHAIRPEDDFVMDAGFDNFAPVRAGQALAKDRAGVVKARESGVILMPLYQKLGEDGFFIGREVAPAWLRISALLRRVGIQRIVQWLPGVKRDANDPETLIVDTRIARLFPLQVFHLLGFRRRRWSGNKLIVSRRKHDSISPFKTAS